MIASLSSTSLLNDSYTYSIISFIILLAGALMIAGVGVMVFSFYVDDYWADEEYRKSLKGDRGQVRTFLHKSNGSIK